MNIELRIVKDTEWPLLQRISRETFVETFGKENTEEDLAKYLAEDLGEETLRKELSHPDSVFYFAILDGEVAGYMKINEKSTQTEQGHGKALELQRIYVYAARKGKGIGKLLLQKAMSIAKEKNAVYLWLGVWEKNYPAIAFYKKLGFEKFSEHIFMLGEDAQTDHLMRIQIQ